MIDKNLLESHIEGMKAAVGKEKALQFLRHFKGALALIEKELKERNVDEVPQHQDSGRSYRVYN